MKQTFILGAFALSSFFGVGQQFELLSSQDNVISMKHTLQQTDVVYTQIDNQNFQDFTKSNKVTTMTAGAPAIPYFTESVIIPNSGEISLEVEHDGFVDYTNVNIAPSKGHLTRNIDPSTVAYTFGTEYSTDAFYPGDIAVIGSPFNIRNTRGVTVSVSPYQYNPVTKTLRVYSNVRTNVVINENESGINELTTTTSIQRDVFSDIYNEQYLNSQVVFGRYTPLEETGEMLVIAKDSYIDEVQPLVDWKIQSGIKTTVVGTSTAGTTDTQIKAYIQSFYATNPNLVYILLVGDHGDVASHTYGMSGNSEQLWSDTYYAQLTGTDLYPEAFIGRFSGNANEITTMVDRTLEYEKTPATGDWMTKAIGLGSDEGAGYGDDSEADWQHLRNIRTKLLGFGYTEVHEFYDGSHGGADASGDPSSTLITPAVNSGVGLFNYTGHGAQNICVTGNYSSTHINQAVNNGKYPLVISVACNNGTFTSGTCISETWMRATNNSTPSGSIAACGSSILMAWAEPMQVQDEMAEIIAESYANNKKTTIGGIFYNSQMSMLEDYNSNTNAREVMETWVMFGDPSTLFRNKVTTNLTASHVSNVNLGETSVTVTCNVEGALIAITQEGVILGTGIVSGGTAVITFTALTSDQTLIVTATKQNYKPYQGNIQVGEGPTGIDSDEMNFVNVYPNPATEFVTLEWSGSTPTAVQLMDLSGKVIYSVTPADLNGTSAVISTSDLSSGLYLLNVTTNEKVSTVKIAVK
jgi:gingipain R